MDKKTIINTLQLLNKEYREKGFEFVGLFGSYARGTEDLFSDIDLTYRINHELFYKDNAFAKLEELQKIKKELEKRFHKKVDLIPANTKNPMIQESLQREQIAI